MKYVNLYFHQKNLKFIYNNLIKKKEINLISTKINLSKNFLLIFLKNGYKEKIFKWFQGIIGNLYRIISSQNSTFIFSNELRFNLSINNFHWNFNYLLSWIFEIINFCFFYTISSTSNMFKKKQKKKISYRLKFFKKNAKYNLLVKFLFFKSLKLNFNFFKDKLYFTLLDFILNYKNSWLYLFKIFFYKKLFKL